jgi:DNA (cytosine-5)-methyltransferase 1
MAGSQLRLGVNHWDRAIETHATNFQNADHECADVSQTDPRRYPATDILLASPECTNHSLAKGARRRKPQAASLFEDGPAGDAEQERSRATMFDVVRFAEAMIARGRPYKAIVVENVVDAFKWGPADNGALFDAWLIAMRALEYEHEIVWLNSMFCPPVPQSRDRMYVVFWRKGQRRPNLQVEPPSWCPACERVVAGQQTWKRLDSRPWGRYGAQYLYSCPECHRVVLPGACPAAEIIDWTLPAPKIRERTRPLAKTTRERIRRGLERLASEPFAIRLLQSGAPRPLTLPLVTQTRRHDMAMVIPVAANTFERTPGNRAKDPAREPLATVHGTLDRAIVVPPMGNSDPRSATTAPAPTQTTTTRAALVMANTEHGVPRPADRAPAQTLRTEGGLGVVEVQRNGGVREPERPLHTVRAGGQHHGVVIAHYDPGWARRTGERPSGGITTRDSHSLVVPYQSEPRPATEPAATVTTVDRHALVVPAGGTWAETATPAREPRPTQTSSESHGIAWGDSDIDECRFRMFALHEIADAMSMRWHHSGGEYVVLGNKRERMAQYGNAVTPPVMQLLVSRLLEALDEG